MLRREEGFTLVEMVIAMGMFSLVMGAILVFMTSGSKSYGYSSGELNMQMESQMLINQVRDMVYDSNYAEYQPAKKALLLYKISVSPRETEAVTEKVYTPVGFNNIVKKRVIYWRNKKLYYEEVEPSDPSAARTRDDAPGYPEDSDHLLCDYVDSFDASVIGKTGDIRFKVSLKNGLGNHYDLDEKISMRSSWLDFPHKEQDEADSEKRTDYY